MTPFDSDDIQALAASIGVERVLFGSDYPHTDCLAEPASIGDSLTSLDSAGLRRMLHDNARELV